MQRQTLYRYPNGTHALYPTPSPAARRLLLNLFSISRSVFDRPYSLLPFTKPGASVNWCRSGRGTLRLGNSEWRVEPGQFWVYGTDQPRAFIPDPGQRLVADGFWFTGLGVQEWMEELDTKRQPQFCLHRPQRVFHAYAQMLKVAHFCPPNWEFIIHRHLTDVLEELSLARNLLAVPETSVPPGVERVLKAIATEPARKWQATDLARIAGMSYSAFGILFRNVLKEAPHDYLMRVRLDLARRELANPKLLVKEVASRLNFPDKNSFTKFFHKHAGVSPTHFRQVYLKAFQSQAQPSSKT